MAAATRVATAALCVALAVATTVPAPAGGASVAPPWRQSLATCWTDVACRRGLIVSHGGDWDLTYPYDSMAAFARAYTDGTDAVKGDYRVSSDGVGVVCHSSPIEWYESPQCAGRFVENMTVAEVQTCKMALSNETFASVPELLAWADGKVIVMLCIKKASDIPHAIAEVVAHGAQSYTFLEIRVNDLIANVGAPHFDEVYYLAEGGSVADLDALLNATTVVPRAFTFEFDPTWPKWSGLGNVTDVIAGRLHKAGVRSLAATSTLLPSVQSQEALFNTGFDVVYTYDTPNGVTARTNVDTARGITPP